MHVVPFALKRASKASLTALQALTAPEGLTPARFDLLYALHLSRHRAPYQFVLAQRLGVTRATICKLVRALQRTGIVELTTAKHDRRLRRITLTHLGRRSFVRLLRTVRRGHARGVMRKAYVALLAPRVVVESLLTEIVLSVERLSRGLGEHTTLYEIESV